ncbi:MAG: family ATPase [Firmicutes bacterium]|nr:family ATPase [Bacillota bacterium]
MHTRFAITAKDRVGITVDILNAISKKGISLVSVEVFPGKVNIKIHEITGEQKKEVIKKLQDIEDVETVAETDLLEYEKNEKKLLAVIDTVDEGILMVDRDCKIEIFNKYCEELFRYSKEEVLGMELIDLLNVNPPLMDLLKTGKNYDNVELILQNDRGQVHYITTGRAIKNDANVTVGGVATLKDINKVIKLVNAVTSTEKGAFSEIVGSSLVFERVKNLAATVAKGNSTVLLRGESGTGKELFAKAIKNLSPRKDESFVTINCAALPENLIESELFGYEKGSFTGAVSARDGLIKEADGGTLFLDEIGELSLSLQAKLLRVLQENKIRKLGSNKEEDVDVRLITATNRDLEAMVKEGKFRQDLYYRLNVFPIFIPPLRKRLEDIPGLVSFFIEKINGRIFKDIKGANADFINGLLQHDWPGNVRELQNVIERAMNICEKNILTEDDLILNIGSEIPQKFENHTVSGEIKLSEAVDIFEKEKIMNSLEKNKTIRKTAKALGVSHTTIINKIKKYNIEWQ